MKIEIFALICGVIAIVVPLVFIWRCLGWQKGIIVLLGISQIDIDHIILTNQPGFMQVPEHGDMILHVFHTVEFLFLVLGLNVADIHRGRSWKNWLFPQLQEYADNLGYLWAWGCRLLLFSMTIHYGMDLCFYTILKKWSHYEVSLLRFLLNKQW